MNDEASFLQAMQENPEDNALRLVFADWLEERGDQRGELIRLLHTLTQSVEVPDRKRLEDRLRGLLASGVQPVGPFWTNSIGMKFAWVPAGTFLMGSKSGGGWELLDLGADETAHPVRFSKGFYLAVYPVTQAVWKQVMGENPSHFRSRSKKHMTSSDNLPVEMVSWNDCQEFLQRLTNQDGQPYRFPTEAEWEYACRAGTTTAFYFGKSISTDQVNYDGECYCERVGVHRGKPTPVGSFPPNGWGLYDMHGNVFESCWDWYDEFPKGEVVDPKGPATGEYRTNRGGSFDHDGAFARSAYRGWGDPTSRHNCQGFRPVMSSS